jgi:hypothetical protein
MNSDEAELQDIIEEYIRDVPGRFQQLATCLKEFDRTAAPGYLTEAISEAHRLRGTGTVFGHPWISEIAGHVEDNLKVVYKQIFRKGNP